MPLIANNVIIKSQTPEPKPVVQKEQPKPARRVYDPNEILLVVNGVEKKISAKSKYLLDLLTIEENDK